MKKIRLWVALLLVAGACCVPFTWSSPAPAPLTLVRTEAVLTASNPPNMNMWVPAVADLDNLTADADTTNIVNTGGRCVGRLRNESGGSITVTFYEASSETGNELTMYDQDGVAVAAVTLADDTSHELPTGISGAEWLIVKLSTGTASDVSLILWR